MSDGNLYIDEQEITDDEWIDLVQIEDALGQSNFSTSDCFSEGSYFSDFSLWESGLGPTYDGQPLFEATVNETVITVSPMLWDMASLDIKDSKISMTPNFDLGFLNLSTSDSVTYADISFNPLYELKALKTLPYADRISDIVSIGSGIGIGNDALRFRLSGKLFNIGVVSEAVIRTSSGSNAFIRDGEVWLKGLENALMRLNSINGIELY